MRRTSALAGIIGLILLAFGILDYFIASGFHLFVAINVVAGVFALVLWATTSSRESLGQLVGSRRTRYGAHAGIYTVIFVALLITVNFLASRYNHRIDTTQEGIFSLSPQSIKIVRALKKPVVLYGFFQGGQNLKAQQLYSNYAYASHFITYQIIDPDRHPEMAERYKVTVMGTTRVQYGGNDPAHGTNVTKLSEENLTNAILKLEKGGNKKVYFVEGDGEANPDDAKSSSGLHNFAEALEGEGYTVHRVLLAAKPAVPEDCSLLVVAGPTREINPHVLGAINDYLKRGGHALVMFRPPGPDGSDPEAPLAEMVRKDWGVVVGNNIVVDQVLRLFAGPALGISPIVDHYGEFAITHDFNQRTVFPLVRSVAPQEEGRAGLTVIGVAKTSNTSWAETNLADLYQHQKASYGPGDQKGPITVVTAVQGFLKTLGYAKDGQARLVVLGSTAVADNQYFNQFDNRDFLMNCADWLTGEENAISIRPRTLHASSFRLTVDQFSIVFALSVLLLPELLLIAGIAVWWERRN